MGNIQSALCAFQNMLDYTYYFTIAHQKYRQIRCSYCDFLQEQYQIKAIIGNFFYKKHRSYSPDKYDEFVEKIDLHYIETQLCLFDKTCIIDKHLHI